MQTAIDSLFLELGIDTSKFSKDQQRALEKIKQFESATRKSADKAVVRVKKVGEAFRDIADETAIGASARRLDTMAVKLKALGQSGRVSGGVTGGLGMMAEGLGMLLSPATLAVGALGLLGKAAWDFNEKMTATNATIFRQSKLSGLNAKSLWAWGEAAHTVGGSAASVRGGIAGLQTAIAGGMIGAGMPVQQLVGLARLGVSWNAESGVDIKSLFARVHAMGKREGWARTWALVSHYGLMNESEFNLAMSKGGGAAAYQYAMGKAPQHFSEILRNSLESQALLGKKDIMEASIAERAYGGIQNPMQALVGLMTNLLAAVDTLLSWTIKIANWVGGIAEHFGIKPIGELAGAIERHLLGKAPPALIGGVPVAGKLPGGFSARQTLAMRALMGRGMSQTAAAALVGNASQESTLNPVATSDHGAHIGLFQLDKARQAQFAKVFGYQIGSSKKSLRQQFLDQLLFAQIELTGSQKLAAEKMAAAHGLAAKTRAFEMFDERPGDHSYSHRLLYAQQAFEAGMQYARAYAMRHGAIQYTTTHHTRIDAVNVATQATDAEGMAAGARKALSMHPMITPTAQHQVTLSSHGMAG